MISPKRKYRITAACAKCSYKTAKEIEVEPENLVNAKVSFGKEAATIHRRHPDMNSFNVSHEEM